MQIKITRTQYSALMNIYGPPENVHHMIMSSSGNILSGDEDDFEELLSLISEEIGVGLCSNADAKRLYALAKKVDPSSADWIGM